MLHQLLLILLCILGMPSMLSYLVAPKTTAIEQNENGLTESDVADPQ